jgi:hypothetical protein
VTFEQFAVARLPSLLRYAVVLTGDRDLAQDVVQEVLARAHVKWRRISDADSPRGVRAQDGAERVPVLAAQLLDRCLEPEPFPAAPADAEATAHELLGVAARVLATW